jgi:uncharacterized protein
MRASPTARVLAFLLALFAPAVFAQGTAPDPQRVAAAKELMEVTGVNKQLEEVIAVMGQGFRTGAADAAGQAKAEEAGKEFDAHMKRLMSYRQAMLDDFAALYAEKFTLEELRQVTDFYKSPAGAKFVHAVPELIQAGAQIGIKYSRKAMETPKP